MTSVNHEVRLRWPHGWNTNGWNTNNEVLGSNLVASSPGVISAVKSKLTRPSTVAGVRTGIAISLLNIRRSHGRRWRSSSDPTKFLSDPVRSIQIRQYSLQIWLDPARSIEEERDGVVGDHGGRSAETKEKKWSEGEIEICRDEDRERERKGEIERQWGEVRVRET
ncbi:hypothetical protein L1049_020060 [Liquidambar formosana]|uniref:Uncharacterized protein n=1 Tax=Liquidambar formosana TaxID=63359 RepID=A0AAP0X743_LIQFO